MEKVAAELAQADAELDAHIEATVAAHEEEVIAQFNARLAIEKADAESAISSLVEEVVNNLVDKAAQNIDQETRSHEKAVAVAATGERRKSAGVTMLSVRANTYNVHNSDSLLGKLKQVADVMGISVSQAITATSHHQITSDKAIADNAAAAATNATLAEEEAELADELAQIKEQQRLAENERCDEEQKLFSELARIAAEKEHFEDELAAAKQAATNEATRIARETQLATAKAVAAEAAAEQAANDEALKKAARLATRQKRTAAKMKAESNTLKVVSRLSKRLSSDDLPKPRAYGKKEEKAEQGLMLAEKDSEAESSKAIPEVVRALKNISSPSSSTPPISRMGKPQRPANIATTEKPTEAVLRDALKKNVLRECPKRKWKGAVQNISRVSGIAASFEAFGVAKAKTTSAVPAWKQELQRARKSRVSAIPDPTGLEPAPDKENGLQSVAGLPAWKVEWEQRKAGIRPSTSSGNHRSSPSVSASMPDVDAAVPAWKREVLQRRSRKSLAPVM